MADPDILICEKRGPVAYLTLNRPEAGNVLSTRLVLELAEAALALNQDDSIRAVVIRGAGVAFCAGEDWQEQRGSVVRDCVLDGSAARAVAAIQWPTIAAINGDALGSGLALALACDLRVAAAGACLGVPETPGHRGVASGITQLLPRIVGRARATEMLLLGQVLDAAEAHRVGLVHRLAPAAELSAEVDRLAVEIAAKAPLALKFAKEAVHKGLDLTLEQGMRLECDLYMILQTTADRREGIRSFQEKRSPSYKGE